ncbi:MAG: CPXCG motif-containing cysteine-rich protein [Planctomycetes bacterium]|nr:CPXCG motif-containing cysteine-rich protein [Planctomycetota bacterium]
MDETGIYVCDHCGEEIEVPVDPSASQDQEYVEDCPVCCAPNLLSVCWDADGRAVVSARAE